MDNDGPCLPFPPMSEQQFCLWVRRPTFYLHDGPPQWDERETPPSIPALPSSPAPSMRHSQGPLAALTFYAVSQDTHWREIESA